MAAFLEAFFTVDRDNDETITADELRQYMNENNLEDNFVQKWLKLFDVDGDGTITLEEFCKTLGLIPKEARELRREFSARQLTLLKSLPSDVEVIRVDMTMDLQLEIVRLVREAQRRFQEPRDMARFVKKSLEVSHGRLWQVVIVLGQYWLYYSHEPSCTFHFKMGRHIFLIWRTPE